MAGKETVKDLKDLGTATDAALLQKRQKQKSTRSKI